jgi:GT2 family glycosyltransferase
MCNEFNISVVIATLGGHTLKPTLQALNAGSLVPGEILVCIPADAIFSENISDIENVVIINVPFRGQVAQRAFGFRQARREYVLQLDDDIVVDYFCLERLLDTFHELGSNLAVSPALIDRGTGRSVYERPQSHKFLYDIYFWLMNGYEGYQPGKVSKAGLAIGIDPTSLRAHFIEVDWLAGGCVLHGRKNLVLEDFWARPGKAYCEDLMHSHLLRKAGIHLFINTLARCDLEIIRNSSMALDVFLNDLYRDFCARKYYMKRVGRSSVRMYFYYATRFTLYFLRRLTRR